VCNPEGEEICRFTPEQAAEHWQYPRLGGHAKKFTSCHADQEVPFKVSRDGLRQIKRFMLKSVTSLGEEGALEYKARTVGAVIRGVAVIALGAGASVFSYAVVAARPEGGVYFVFAGLMVYGVCELIRGGWLLMQCRDIRDLADSTCEFR
jgi:hypothetical protein